MATFTITISLTLTVLACVSAQVQNQYSTNNYNQNAASFNRNAAAGQRLVNQQQQQQQQHQSQQHFQRQAQALRAPLLPPPNPNQFSQRLQQPFANPIRPFVPITSYSNDVAYDGSYSYAYTTGDGQQQQAQGYLKNAGLKDLEAQSVQGSYSYTSPEGQLITVTYIADENGFRAEGAHLPTPPPIPEAIQKSLALIAQTQPVSAQFNAAYNQPRFQTGHQLPTGAGQNYNRFG
ncbi:endocuticle structural glycoprotein SgAbd-2-like [Anopheles bellator]|uniref:endocuticle structural glycoprotein SgAbd-2-like n=1 Tax=Anopheles bellator TaxID=139047 RepID=UPI0026492A9B|nr:endocuticle structural glycoprotein SgAbd-2-like [Anopheles bellator]